MGVSRLWPRRTGCGAARGVRWECGSQNQIRDSSRGGARGGGRSARTTKRASGVEGCGRWIVWKGLQATVPREAGERIDRGDDFRGAEADGGVLSGGDRGGSGSGRLHNPVSGGCAGTSRDGGAGGDLPGSDGAGSGGVPGSESRSAVAAGDYGVGTSRYNWS